MNSPVEYRVKEAIDNKEEFNFLYDLSRYEKEDYWLLIDNILDDYNFFNQTRKYTNHESKFFALYNATLRNKSDDPAGMIEGTR